MIEIVNKMMNIKDNFKEGLQEEESKEIVVEKEEEDDLQKFLKQFCGKTEEEIYFPKMFKNDGSYIASGSKYWKTIFNSYYDCFA